MAVDRRLDEAEKERVRSIGLRFELRMELYRDEPGMTGNFDDLGQLLLGVGPGDDEPRLVRIAAAYSGLNSYRWRCRSRTNVVP